jgi:hypothetical protein
MKIVKIKMNQNFTIEYDDGGSTTFKKADTHFAIDGGDYWLTQSEPGDEFVWVIPKEVKPETLGVVAEVVAE